MTGTRTARVTRALLKLAVFVAPVTLLVMAALFVAGEPWRVTAGVGLYGMTIAIVFALSRLPYLETEEGGA